jgi:hypothetical protein
MKVTLVGRRLPQGNVMETKLFILTALMAVIAAFARARGPSPPPVPAQPELNPEPALSGKAQSRALA